MEFGVQALSVTELNEYVRKLLAVDPLLKSIAVTGEISGYKHYPSGHRYFTLKDDNARVPCVLFRQNGQRLGFEPADGMRVVLYGSASLYPADGKFQVYVTRMEKCGVGELYVRFEALKRRLSDEGLFDAARKKPIPMCPKTIGLVTSEKGAAVRDMIRVARRRNPNVGIVIAPCAVQGAGAAEEIAEAIALMNRRKEADVLLVGRGGGSIEDLWAFNEEVVARAIAASEIPIVSCVGHEIDTTIADYVADLRAATPSAAAEVAVPMLDELTTTLRAYTDRLGQALSRGQSVRRLQLARLAERSVLTQPNEIIIQPARQQLETTMQRLSSAYENNRLRIRNRLDHLSGMLKTLDPSGVLERGYTVVEQSGKAVGSLDELNRSETFTVRWKDGRIIADEKHED
ncbi:MAG: exodeoxyribonuclease VII large subunit [Clostridia bacterium]|nr:exodeoxyribonuclease VII large subunit [Clostridia bacterium]